eukprot:CCRYP_008987-RA/>CCRYP_008987-RA protein AED:0.05 eAED:0.05 QI:276/1/1/1/0.5/0.4/5/79/477
MNDLLSAAAHTSTSPFCSICTRSAPSHPPTPKTAATNPVKSRSFAFPHGILETSFVNVPYSPPSPNNTINENDTVGISNGVRRNGDTERNDWYGSEMYEASRRMEAMIRAAEEFVRADGDDSDSMSEGYYYCRSCLDRVGRALDEHSSLLLDECLSYDEVASSEEQRVESIRRALSGLVDNTNLDCAVDEGNAVEWALDQFNQEIEALTHACQEQEKELQVLQNLMQDQLNRSKALASQEENAFHALNAVERDMHNFNEESHHVSNMCSSVMAEIDALSKVKLVSVPFHIDVSNNHVGRYPLINNLRLAYRTNEKANLHHEEINTAWVQAAQLVAFTCGLYPRFHSSIRIIPLSYPCAKIQIMTSAVSGRDDTSKRVYNLGWDMQACSEHANHHIPSPSLIAFLSLLCQLVTHILAESNLDQGLPCLPFEMSPTCIDGVDVTKLLDSDIASWSSVVYCTAVNLHWLSKLPVKMPCIL